MYNNTVVANNRTKDRATRSNSTQYLSKEFLRHICHGILQCHVTFITGVGLVETGNWRKLADGAMVNAGITAVIMPFKKKMSGEHITDENYLEDVAICLNH